MAAGREETPLPLRDRQRMNPEQACNLPLCEAQATSDATNLAVCEHL
jgi:hypothetical protein